MAICGITVFAYILADLAVSKCCAPCFVLFSSHVTFCVCPCISRALHGDIAQAQREATLAGFRSGKFSVLVATDVAARGLDINGVELIIQVEPPKDPEVYIHRSGRTGRAGHTGVCITLVGRKHEERIPYIEQKAGW